MATSARGSWHTPPAKPAAVRQRPAQAPWSPAPTMPTLVARPGASAWAATAATAPVRSAVTDRASRSASGTEVAASERTTTPWTVGRPRAGLPGKDETHLSIASPSPSAGIARKSPSGGLGR